MEQLISPKFLAKLANEINEKIWIEFGSYKEVLFYIKRWYEEDKQGFRENFPIIFQGNTDKIDLLGTLNEMPNDLILKIAIDLGIETPDFIPLIPTFKNNLKENYKNPYQSFEKAFKQVEENPDIAIGLANTTLESIIKHILENDDISTKLNKNNTLYKLTEEILKEFNMYPSEEAQKEIKAIGSGLLNASQHIEKLRSNKTLSHGKAKEDYVIDDPLYAYFIINSVSTIGIFLISFYNKKYRKLSNENYNNGKEVSIEDLPF